MVDPDWSFYVSVLFVGRLGAFEDLFDGLPFLSTADSVGLALCVIRELRLGFLRLGFLRLGLLARSNLHLGLLLCGSWL